MSAKLEVEYAEMKARAEAAERERDVLRMLGEKVNEIRKSIIGAQTFNWSEHAYPLVAALDSAGFDGGSYEDNHKNVGTLIEQIKVAERDLAIRNDRVRELEQTLMGLEATNYGQARDLAAAQAHALELRAAMDGLDEHGWDCPTMRMGSGNGPCDCANARLHAAISAPQGTTALREFGLKVAQNTFSATEAADGSWTAEAIVDAVLKGAE